MKSRIFKTRFDNLLDMDNRWVKLEQVITWDKLAKVFFKRLDRYQGRDTVDLRSVMGAMFIQHTLNLTDRNTVQNIHENIYLQYFVGLSSFQIRPVFDHSLLPTFRKRLVKKGSKELNDIFIEHHIDNKTVKHRKARKPKSNDDEPKEEQPSDDEQTRTEIESAAQRPEEEN